MHDCHTMESKLVDLVFDELGADESSRLLAEIKTCAGCLSEYRSMTETLIVFDEVVEASLPEESFWPEHRAALSRHLEGISPRALLGRASVWKRLLTARLPVPVPVAAIILLALLLSSVLALRTSTSESKTASQPTVVIATPPEVIEVPVVQEKIVTRIVYIEKGARAKNDSGRQFPITERAATALAARHGEAESVQGGFFTRANLTDFQPPDELKIRIVKRSNSDEN
jgi:hypothetical protein